MIARIWRGSTNQENAQAYLEFVHRVMIPEIRMTTGNRSVDVLHRRHEDHVEFLVISQWDSLDAIRQFAGTRPERAVVPDEAKAVLLEYDDAAAHYEVT